MNKFNIFRINYIQSNTVKVKLCAFIANSIDKNIQKLASSQDIISCCKNADKKINQRYRLT